MASTPTSKSQVQAYRFVLRRMESALVRKDAVMLHDPMRSHKRATLVGVIAGVAILLGFMIVGILKPAQSLPSSGIVIAQPSGQVYVVNQSPYELIPVFNLTSARLLIYAQSQTSSSSTSSNGGSSSSANSVPSVSQPTVVSDTELAGVPMGRLTGIPDGPQALPNPGTSSQNWWVCDNIPRLNTPNATQNQVAQSTVLVGVPSIGSNMQAQGGLLVQGPEGTDYLIYHHSTNINNENDSSVKAEINLTDQRLVTALGLNNTQPRSITAALLAAIPSVGAIQDPFVGNPNVGNPGPSGLGNSALTVGTAFQETNATGQQRFFAVLSNTSVEPVSGPTADIIQAERGSGTNLPSVSPSELASVNQIDPINSPERLPNVNDYPAYIPQILDAGEFPVTCLGWTANYSDLANPQVDTTVTVGQTITTANYTSVATGQMQPTTVGTPGPSGIKVDNFFMNPTSALVDGVGVRSANGAGEFTSGPIRLVTPRGVVYSVDALATAQALGIANTTAPFDGLYPAPESILGLLPTGAEELNTNSVQRTFDSVAVPDNAGQFTQVAPTTAGGN